MERTLSIIKPDAVSRGAMGKIIARFEAAGIRVVAAKMVQLGKDEAKAFYAVHRDKPFYDSLTDFMSSGPVMVMVLEGNDVIQQNRRIMGATNPRDADPGTIRAEFGTDVEKNAVHGSDSPLTAAKEIAFFFSEYELTTLARRSHGN